VPRGGAGVCLSAMAGVLYGGRRGVDCRQECELCLPVCTFLGQVGDEPCVRYIGPGGSGNYVKMVHNGIEYGDMQLISEAYDILKTVGGLTNPELAAVFTAWNEVGGASTDFQAPGLLQF
jgi:6-phosphogluconate dehydrogenase